VPGAMQFAFLLIPPKLTGELKKKKKSEMIKNKINQEFTFNFYSETINSVL